MIVLQPHALKCRVLLHIFGPPSKCAGIFRTNPSSDRSLHHGDAAKSAEKSVTLSHLELGCGSGHPRFGQHFARQIWWKSWHSAYAVDLRAPLTPQRLCPFG